MTSSPPPEVKATFSRATLDGSPGDLGVFTRRASRHMRYLLAIFISAVVRLPGGAEPLHSYTGSWDQSPSGWTSGWGPSFYSRDWFGCSVDAAQCTYRPIVQWSPKVFCLDTLLRPPHTSIVQTANIICSLKLLNSNLIFTCKNMGLTGQDNSLQGRPFDEVNVLADATHVGWVLILYLAMNKIGQLVVPYIHRSRWLVVSRRPFFFSQPWSVSSMDPNPFTSWRKLETLCRWSRLIWSANSIDTQILVVVMLLHFCIRKYSICSTHVVA